MAEKITGEYIGRITPNGLIETKTRERTVYEYANAMFLSSILDEITPQLRNCFPDEWKEIAALAIAQNHKKCPNQVRQRRMGKTLSQH